MAADFPLESLFTSEVEVGEGGMTFLPPFSSFFPTFCQKIHCKVIQYLQKTTLADTSGTAKRVKLSEWQWLWRGPTELTVFQPEFRHGKLALLNLGYEISVSRMQWSSKSNKGKRNFDSFFSRPRILKCSKIRKHSHHLRLFSLLLYVCSTLVGFRVQKHKQDINLLPHWEMREREKRSPMCCLCRYKSALKALLYLYAQPPRCYYLIQGQRVG